ncbi:MAG: type VI secretion system tube protein Hcp [Methylomicrobium sp.]|nr:type VI secretion system tube protein Hcp [Methylomicrobium sp.]
MAVDMFINLGPKIKGETKDKEQSKNKDCDVLAWSWGESNSGSFHTGGGGGAGKVNVQDLSLTKWVDSATPAIWLSCALGEHIDKCVLLVRKAGGKQEKYMEITMEKCMITSVSTGGSGGEDRLTENISLNFAKVKLEYFVQDDKGSTKSSGDFKYDIEQNVKF